MMTNFVRERERERNLDHYIATYAETYFDLFGAILQLSADGFEVIRLVLSMLTSKGPQ